ncbi:hypothetical protein V6M85_09410 [Sulfolobus tengchongensis]|uniref:Uncharacterized protein n=1 Tax=Sulfolobus tengchongensis TaxID=207809 RepID=A0AAX4KXT7_9CREN
MVNSRMVVGLKQNVGFSQRVSGVIPLMGLERISGEIHDFSEVHGLRVEYKVYEIR